VDPTAFSDEYQRGGCSLASFTATEKQPQALLAYSTALAAAAVFHTEDMATGDFLSHSSSDGTSFGARLDRFYDGQAIGENVSMGYSDAFVGVLRGWMCSDGHRSNIMEPMWDELGVSTVGVYRTQDFGLGGVDVPAIAMGAHTPLAPSGQVALMADAHDPGGVTEMRAVLDGTMYAMTLAFGDEASGTWSLSASVDAGCHVYWFESTGAAGEGRFPEVGAYGFGPCTFDDPEAGWFASARVADGTATPDDPGTEVGVWEGSGSEGGAGGGCGCATAGTGASGRAAGWGAVGLGLLAARRRRRYDG
ncbi:MAG: hypothetical protein RLZZ383_1927, partial [Pseudomonadota bacterium]